jgi:hypothetical protein
MVVNGVVANTRNREMQIIERTGRPQYGQQTLPRTGTHSIRVVARKRCSFQQSNNWRRWSRKVMAMV